MEIKTDVAVKTASPRNLEEFVPNSGTKIKDLGVKLAVLTDQEQADRAEFIEKRGRFEGIHPLGRMLLNESWWHFVQDKYQIDTHKYKHIVYNINDGIIYEALD